jgi:hypothetical protein
MKSLRTFEIEGSFSFEARRDQATDLVSGPIRTGLLYVLHSINIHWPLQLV